MKEIKFRAWNKKRKEYELLDSLFELQKMNLVGYEYNERIFEQYTGLKDKNNKEIYEGDIVKIEFTDDMELDENEEPIFSDGCNISVVKDRGIVKGDFGDFNLWLVDWAMDHDYIFKVIGNIHENPELLRLTK